MKDEEKIKELAELILNIEKECQQNKEISKKMNEIEQLIQGLSLEDMLAIDTYIQEKILTK